MAHQVWLVYVVHNCRSRQQGGDCHCIRLVELVHVAKLPRTIQSGTRLLDVALQQLQDEQEMKRRVLEVNVGDRCFRRWHAGAAAIIANLLDTVLSLRSPLWLLFVLSVCTCPGVRMLGNFALHASIPCTARHGAHKLSYRSQTSFR